MRHENLLLFLILNGYKHTKLPIYVDTYQLFKPIEIYARISTTHLNILKSLTNKRRHNKTIHQLFATHFAKPENRGK